MNRSAIRSTVFSVFASVLVSSAASAAAIPEDHRGSGRYYDEPAPEAIEQAGHVECPEGTRYRSSSANQCQPHAAKSVLLAQGYSENPTFPEGHPPNTQRSQAGGTR